MRKRKLMLLLLGAGIWIRSTGQNPPQQDPIPLPLDSAIQMSLRQSRQLKIDHAKIDEARANYQQARSMKLPTAKLSFGYTRLSNNVDPFAIQLPNSNTEKVLNPQIVNHYTPALSIGQTIYAGGRIRHAERSMKLLEEAARLDVEKNRTDLVYNSTSAWFNLFRIQQIKRIMEENIKQVQGHVKDLQNYEKNGLALKNDVLKIELQLSDLEHSLIEINSDLDIASYNMSIMLGLPAASAYVLSPYDFNRTITIRTADDYLTEALNNRADLKSVNKKIGSAILGVRSAIGNYYPTLSVGSNYYYNNPNQRVFPQEQKFKATWDAGITLSWNIHSLYTNKHQVAANKALADQKQFEREALLDRIKMEVNNDYNTYLRNRQRINVSEHAVSQAEENYRLVSNRFRNNTVLISDLTDANTQVLQTRINLLVDKADAGLAYYKLLQSTASINY